MMWVSCVWSLCRVLYNMFRVLCYLLYVPIMIMTDGCKGSPIIGHYQLTYTLLSLNWQVIS